MPEIAGSLARSTGRTMSLAGVLKVDGGCMSRRKAWMLIAAALLMALMPLAAAADDDRGAVQTTVEDNWPDEVPTPWFCLIHHPVSVCFPPW